MEKMVRSYQKIKRSDLFNNRINMNIRSATFSDSYRIAKIHIEVWKNAYKDFLPKKYLEDLNIFEWESKWTKRLSESFEKILVAEIKGNIEGFCSFLLNKENRYCEIVALYINPNKLRQGIGTVLLQKIISIADSHLKKQLIIWVFKANLKARKFYKKNGFINDNIKRIWGEKKGFSIPEMRYSKFLK